MTRLLEYPDYNTPHVSDNTTFRLCTYVKDLTYVTDNAVFRVWFLGLIGVLAEIRTCVPSERLPGVADVVEGADALVLTAASVHVLDHQDRFPALGDAVDTEIPLRAPCQVLESLLNNLLSFETHRTTSFPSVIRPQPDR